MISKHIVTHAKNDNYKRLANYIAGHNQEKEMNHDQPYPREAGREGLAEKRLHELSKCTLEHRTFGKREERTPSSILSFDARPDHQSDAFMRWNSDHAHRPLKAEKREKCLMSWCAGCWAGDDYELAIQEVIDTQALNTRATKEKTYHLIVSFRPEDQAKLTPENFRAIESRFAEVLGLEEHQRHCGVHVNTSNVHMHIAYNLIHPEKLTRKEPWRDYAARDRLCRELEQEYGISVDNGRDKSKERGLSGHAATMEAHSGQQSFEGYARDQARAILEDLKLANNWEEVHHIFGNYGLELAPRGAGLVIKDRHGKQRAKASAVHRDLSLKKMVARFGAFQKAQGKLPASQRRYEVKPLQKAADRKQLWEEFQAVRQAQKQEREAIAQKWRKYREDTEKKPMARQTRASVLQLARHREAEERHALKLKYPADNWLAYLQQQAQAGNETALAVLRSRKEEIHPDPEQKARLEAEGRLLEAKRAILENRELSARAKRELLSQAIMEKLEPEATAMISKHGAIIFTMPNGGKVCDTGQEISFSEDARSQALAYMSAKWHIKKREKDSQGRDVFVLADGQKMRDTGQRRFERPAPQRLKEQQKEMER